jgi:hypothetical protein
VRSVCISDLKHKSSWWKIHFRVAGWQLKKIGIWAADLDLAQQVMNGGRVARASSSRADKNINETTSPSWLFTETLF